MENKKVIQHLKRQLKDYNLINWEIKNKEDYIDFLRYATAGALIYQNKSLWSPFGLWISELLVNNQKVQEKLNNLTKTMI